MTNIRHSRTDGETKTVEGDIVIFSQETETPKTPDISDSSDNTYDQIINGKISIDAGRLSTLAEAFEKTRGYFNKNNSGYTYVDAKVCEIKEAIEGLLKFEDAYVKTRYAVSACYNQVFDINNTLVSLLGEKNIDPKTLSGMNSIKAPYSLNQILLENINKYVNQINEAISGIDMKPYPDDNIVTICNSMTYLTEDMKKEQNIVSMNILTASLWKEFIFIHNKMSNYYFMGRFDSTHATGDDYITNLRSLYNDIPSDSENIIYTLDDTLSKKGLKYFSLKTTKKTSLPKTQSGKGLGSYISAILGGK